MVRTDAFACRAVDAEEPVRATQLPFRIGDEVAVRDVQDIVERGRRARPIQQGTEAPHAGVQLGLERAGVQRNALRRHARGARSISAVSRNRVDAALRAQVLEAVAHELGEALALQNNQLRRVRGAPRREVAQRGVLRGDGRAALAVEPLETARARAGFRHGRSTCVEINQCVGCISRR